MGVNERLAHLDERVLGKLGRPRPLGPWTPAKRRATWLLMVGWLVVALPLSVQGVPWFYIAWIATGLGLPLALLRIRSDYWWPYDRQRRA
jgi:hypothetical protein